MKTTIQEIKTAISHLPADALSNLRQWFEEFDAKAWDAQFEQDVKSGKLEKIAERAINDFHAGKCKKA
jgi:hypothetical protein